MTPHPIYLLRHGQTEWNAQHRLQGRMDSPLTARGVEQARRMERTLRSLLDRGTEWRLVASPQPRARTTAEIVGAGCGLSISIDDRLREASMGAWEGLTRQEIDGRWPNPSGAYRFLQAPGGETWHDVSARATMWLQDLRGPTIAVSHGITGRVLRALYLGVEVESLPSMAALSQDGLYRLEQGTVAFIECVETLEDLR